MTKPKLSIIIPMRGGVEHSWLQELLKIQGNTEFILVYPPNVPFIPITEPRLCQIRSPLQGELIQRVTALLNASGEYVLSINCDEYIHPHIVAIAEDYFSNFPDSYFFRLKQVEFPFGKLPVDKPWGCLNNIKDIEIRKPNSEKNYSQEEKEYTMREIPIIPLDNKPDFLALFRGRKDHRGPHQENFDKKVWKNELVQETLKGIVPTFTIFGPLKYVPFWTADRLMGLSVQAKFFEPGKIAGHWLSLPEQLRTEDNPPNYPRKNRRYVLSELSILRQFPGFGYIWNLVVFNRGGIFMIWYPKDTLRSIAEKIGLKKPNISQ
ncbi:MULTISPECIES: transposase [unclassified Anabaena]|uniref:transposase n=1 Tax=unclassified Anabaena TaxID=2619674 RepID=UPI001444B623|nr:MULTISPECIES: transposase [unclassified Anabaena]MTJ09789.1 transposase [Anabaena sp. UHCC 0204]MTJ52764.1 transposase [Anabaena sp. UHCC 0253]